MVASQANAGFGCLLQVGDSGVGAGVKAGVEWGTSNQKIRVRFKTAGLVGNGKNITVAVSGSTYVITTLTANAISITVPTTATVAQVIAFLYAQAEFLANWEADYGATPGDGSGTITARTVTATSGGSDGAEVFTTIAEVKNFSGPNPTAALAEVTHMLSDNNTREYLPTLIDPGELNLTINLLAGSVAHRGILTDEKNRTKRNFKIIFSDSAGSVMTFAGYYTSFGITAELDQAIMAAITVKLTSFPTFV